MKPIYETIEPNPGSSFAVFHYEKHDCEELPFWHIHPELEIVYIEKGKGTRHIGSHVSMYEEGDLIMLGSGIPHSNFGNNDYLENTEVIIQINNDLLKNQVFQLNEFKAINELLTRTNLAVSFYGDTKLKAGKLMKRIYKADPFHKFMLLMELLNELANSNFVTELKVGPVALDVYSMDYNRIAKVFDWVNQNYSHKITLTDIADIAGLTVNSFCRFFKNVTGKTFTTYLNEFRINKACELLGRKESSVTEILYQCGFTEPAYFSRLFKSITSLTPSDYRARAWTK
ncbi:MAG TPA: AraC family transcriptional regulator [Bacteroidales bacterium]